jgi:hypothetical protein
LTSLIEIRKILKILPALKLFWLNLDHSTYNTDLDNVQFKFLKRIAHVIGYTLSNCSVRHLKDSIELHHLEVRRNLTGIMVLLLVLRS